MPPVVSPKRIGACLQIKQRLKQNYAIIFQSSTIAAKTEGKCKR
jgi:hypothetical protein